MFRIADEIHAAAVAAKALHFPDVAVLNEVAAIASTAVDVVIFELVGHFIFFPEKRVCATHATLGVESSSRLPSQLSQQ